MWARGFNIDKKKDCDQNGSVKTSLDTLQQMLTKDRNKALIALKPIRSLVIGTLVLWDLSCQIVFGEVYK